MALLVAPPRDIRSLRFEELGRHCFAMLPSKFHFHGYSSQQAMPLPKPKVSRAALNRDDFARLLIITA